MKEIIKHLTFLYGKDKSPRIYERVQILTGKYGARIPLRDGELTERDSLLITYGDQVQSLNKKPLQTLNEFCRQYVSDIVSGIHILPFYPWTSDDGFSVVDYRKVDSNLGDWDDISSMQDCFRLMLDGVITYALFGAGSLLCISIIGFAFIILLFIGSSPKRWKEIPHDVI